ncbi:MAG TPA: UPF0175 family protein [Isosphaeraceae bacterium]|jgi:hypothetical protein|nr:UPF0175 family protein [Isosphaeraceae bacterium]
MPKLTIELPDEAFAALDLSPDEAKREAGRILAIQWYAEGRISQGTAAAIAGLSRAVPQRRSPRRRCRPSRSRPMSCARNSGMASVRVESRIPRLIPDSCARVEWWIVLATLFDILG